MDCKQTKLWFPKPYNIKKSKNILKLSKANFGLVKRWIMGHCFLAHQESIKNNRDSTCNKCFLGDQTLWHLLKDCPATLLLLSELLDDQWTTGTLLKIITQIGYFEVITYLLPLTNVGRDCLTMTL